MEDFLKDRPVISGAEVSGAAPVANTPVVTNPGAFAQLRREAPRAAAPGLTAPVANAAEAQQLTGEHGTRVQTIVERGRVTKIIVTCSCGKTTEIACTY